MYGILNIILINYLPLDCLFDTMKGFLALSLLISFKRKKENPKQKQTS